MPIKISDSDTSSKSEVSHTEVEESNIPPSRSSIISPNLSNEHKISTYSSSRSKEESDDDEDDIEVGKTKKRLGKKQMFKSSPIGESSG